MENYFKLVEETNAHLRAENARLEAENRALLGVAATARGSVADDGVRKRVQAVVRIPAARGELHGDLIDRETTNLMRLLFTKLLPLFEKRRTATDRHTFLGVAIDVVAPEDWHPEQMEPWTIDNLRGHDFF